MKHGFTWDLDAGHINRFAKLETATENLEKKPALQNQLKVSYQGVFLEIPDGPNSWTEQTFDETKSNSITFHRSSIFKLSG